MEELTGDKVTSSKDREAFGLNQILANPLISVVNTVPAPTTLQLVTANGAVAEIGDEAGNESDDSTVDLIPPRRSELFPLLFEPAAAFALYGEYELVNNPIDGSATEVHPRPAEVPRALQFGGGATARISLGAVVGDKGAAEEEPDPIKSSDETPSTVERTSQTTALPSLVPAHKYVPLTLKEVTCVAAVVVAAEGNSQER